MSEATPKRAKWTTRLLYTGMFLLVAGLIVGQLGINPFASMLSITFAFLLAIIAAIIVLISMLRFRGTSHIQGPGWAALVLGILAVVVGGGRFSGGGGGAPIHDISTDMTNPPAFVDIAPLRADAPNPAEYLDDGTAEAQAQAYPDIKTLVIGAAPDTVFADALAAAEAMGWEIVASVPSEGRIEATATTPFVGFKDDIVVRIKPGADGTLVDVRSKSRIGKGDMGVNAARVREFGAQLTGG